MITEKIILRLTFAVALIFALSQVNAKIVYQKEGSPHLIQEDIIIDNKDSIVIEPGAILILSPDVDIITNGVIIIEGTPEDPISLLPEVSEVGWGKIEITCPNKTSKIRNAKIVDGTIQSRYCDMEMDNVTFIINQTLAWNNPVVFVIDASVNFINSAIYGNNTGEGFQMLNSENVHVKNCFFSKIPDAVELTNIVGGLVSKNRFEYIPDDGIDLNNCTNTLIDSNIIIGAVDRGIELGSENNGNSENIMVKRNVLVGCGVGVILKEESYGHLINNTFYNNTIGVKCIADNGTRSGSTMNIQNCIFYNSLENDIFKDPDSEIITNYCISDSQLLNGINNIHANPMFIDALEYNFNLQEDSPCINAGDPDLPLDPDNTISDIGAYYFNTDTTGIYENNDFLQSIEIFPNPFVAEFNISVSNKFHPTVELFSLNGKKLSATIKKVTEPGRNKITVTPNSKIESGAIIICNISDQSYNSSFLLYHQ